jgi:hypothetical protein
MASAARWPCAMASTMEAGPSTASPPAKMPATLVASVSLSATMRPPGPVATPSPAESIPWPMVTMTVSAASALVFESSKRGLNRLFSSNTLVQARKATPVTLPPAVRSGPRLLWKTTPSSSASAASQACAGISARLSRQATSTDFTPGSRRAQRAASMATSPPPMTTTFGPMRGVSPLFTWRRKSSPAQTPGASSPGMPSLRLIHAPGAANTASNPPLQQTLRIGHRRVLVRPPRPGRGCTGSPCPERPWAGDSWECRSATCRPGAAAVRTGDAVAQQRQVGSGRQTGRTAAHDGHLGIELRRAGLAGGYCSGLAWM